MKASNFRCWHKADVPEEPVNVRYWGKSGHQNGPAAMSAFDPDRTLIASFPRSGPYPGARLTRYDGRP
jgi:hypothetical protein